MTCVYLYQYLSYIYIYIYWDRPTSCNSEHDLEHVFLARRKAPKHTLEHDFLHEGKHSKQPPPKIQRNRFFDCYSYWTRVRQGFDNSKAHVLGLCGHTLGDDTYIKLNVYIEYVFFQPSRCYVSKKQGAKQIS